DRIDVPGVWRLRGPDGLLLADDAVRRIALDDCRAQHALDRAIGRRHGIEAVLVLVVDAVRPPEMRLRDTARRACKLERELFELESRNLGHAAVPRGDAHDCILAARQPGTKSMGFVVVT